MYAKNSSICAAISIQYRRATDTHTDTQRQLIPMLTQHQVNKNVEDTATAAYPVHSIIAAENVDVSVDGDLAISFKCLRRIFPAAERGIAGKISTPPRSRLYATTCAARQQ